MLPRREISTHQCIGKVDFYLKLWNQKQRVEEL